MSARSPQRFFSGAPSFPTPQQVVHAIYDVMRANPTLWSEGDDFGSLPEMISAGRRRIRKVDVALASEKGDKGLGLARQLYARLLAWRWLEEEEYGLRVTVDRHSLRGRGRKAASIRFGLEPARTMRPSSRRATSRPN